MNYLEHLGTVLRKKVEVPTGASLLMVLSGRYIVRKR